MNTNITNAFTLTRETDHQVRIEFDEVCGNGRIAAPRAIGRMCRKLHLPYCHTYGVGWMFVFVYSRKDENRLAELWKYIRGKRFAQIVSNNGYIY